MSTLADHDLADTIRAYGRFDVNGCMNCGTCTIVCDLSTNEATFPRRSLQRGLLGLRDSLVGSLDPWLCHDCGDCSLACPRQAEPRESMMTLRRYLIGRYDFTGLSARILRSAAWEVGSIIVAALLFLGLVVWYHLYSVELDPSAFLETEMGVEHMFSLIGSFTLAVYLVPLAIMLMNGMRMYWFTMRGEGRPAIPLRLYAKQLRTYFLQLFSQQTFRACAKAAAGKRWSQHLILAAGFGMMSVILVFFLSWFQTDSIYPLYHPQRWLGYLATIALLVPPLGMIRGRIRKGMEQHKFSEASDMIFPIMLVLVALSGIAVHMLRYWELPLACHYAYALHLAIAVPLLVIEMPFGKFSHVLYRPLALYFQAVLESARAEAGSPVGKNLQEEIAA